MTDIASLIIKVDSTDADDASRDLEQLTKQAGRTEKATDKLGKSTGKLSKGFKLQKGAAQQVGFQLQDFAVQVSGGTSAITAFGQQGSQLAGIMGPGGALLGAVIAIGSAVAGVFVSSMSAGSEELEEFEALIISITEKLDRVKLENLDNQIKLQKEAVNEATTAYHKLANQAPVTLSAVEKLFTTQESLRESQRKQLEESSKATTEAYNKQLDAQNALIELEKQRESILVSQDKEQDELKSKSVKRAQDEAQALIDAEADKQKQLDRLRAKLDPVGTLQSRHFDQLDAIESFNISASEKEFLREEAFKQHGERMAAIAKKSVQTTVDAQDQGLTMLTDSQTAALGAIGQITGNMAEIAEKGGKDQFEAYKAFSIATALINTALAASNALANPSLPFPLNVGVAGSIGALGAVQVGMIASQEYQGARAMGGQVGAGGSYLVGERGPEVLTMGASGGNITPNHALGGGEVKVTNVFQISTGVQATVQSEMLRMAPQIAEMSKRSVEAAINSGGSMSRAVGRRG